MMDMATSLRNVQSLPVPLVADSDEMRRALGMMFDDQSVVELRAIYPRARGKRTDAGYFDAAHRVDLVNYAARLNKAGAAVYVTMNRLDPQLLGRYANRVQEYAEATATDANVLRRNWLLLDFDPARPKDTASTEEQLDAAKEQAFRCAEELSADGWPDPLSVMSGNGVHLLYRIDLPNDDPSRDLIKGVLDALAGRFNTKLIKLDQSVFNAGRIVKLPGVVANKGDNIPSAPWRVSQFLNAPTELEVVTAEQLRALIPPPAPARTAATPNTSSAGGVAFDLEGFLGRLGIEYERDMHEGSERFKLRTCPFNSDHGRGEAAVFRAASGALGFKCQHNGCADRRWKDLRDLVDGPKELRQPQPPAPIQAAQTKTGKTDKPRFPRVWLDDARVDLTSTYLVKHLIDSKTFVLIYGPSGQGKTFFTIDLVSHIAGGKPWRGRRVRGCLVVYVAAEAGASIVKRFVAQRDQAPSATGGDRTPLSIVTRGADLLNLSDVEALMIELQGIAKEAGMPIGLVVFDTYSRSTPGGKEDAEDTSAAIAVADRLRDELGAATVFVHHSGKDTTKGARGHSSLFAAADTVVCVEGTVGAIASGCVAEVEKARDGTTGEQFPFRLDVVELGTDEDGDPVTTCVVTTTDAVVTKPKARQLPGGAKVALQALQEAINERGKVMAGTSTIPKGAKATRIEDWRARFALRYGSDGDGKRDGAAVRQAFGRAKDSLLKVQAVGISDPYCWCNT